MISIKNPFVLSKYNITKAIEAIQFFLKIILFTDLAPFSSIQNMEVLKNIRPEILSFFIDAELLTINIQPTINSYDHFTLQRREELRNQIARYQLSDYIK
jgi:hypothetical protein